MKIRHTAKGRRETAAAVLAAGLLLAVAGCGGGDGEGSKESSQQSSEGKDSGEGSEGDDVQPAESAAESIAELNGEDGLVLEINSARRDSGGFVTVSGAVKNTGSKGYFKTSVWRGNEKELVSNGYSLGGAALVDPEGKKRYYVLRDTEGRCLCTTGITKLEPKEEVPIFVQFPAPPEGTTEVEFSLPTFDSATVEITE